MNNVYTYVKLESDIYKLKKKFPFIRCNIIGKSVLERNIYEMNIGEGSKSIHFNASFHANEWITTLVLMRWLKSWLWKAASNHNFDWLKEVRLSIVPMVNPDGVELVSIGAKASRGLYHVEEMNNNKPDYCGWKANIRGVDLNKQFPANWQHYKDTIYCQFPSYRDYPGETPLTEPEAIALKNLVDRNDFIRIIALHTQGKEFYWGYNNCEPSDSKIIADEFERVSSYKGIKDIDSHAGFRDWFISTYNRAGFTIELGKGMNPLPLSQFTEIYKDTAPILNASVYM